MIEHREVRVLRWSQAQMYQVIARIDRYPEFVPGWSESVVRERDEETLRVEQVMGFGPLSWRFESRATLREPEYLHIHAANGPFRTLDIEWQLTPETHDSCRVTLTMRGEPRNRLLRGPVEKFLTGSGSPLLSVFEKRAKALFG